MTSVLKKLKLELEKTERLDKVLTGELGLSRTTIQSWLKAGLISVNGEVVKSNYKAHSGDEVTILQKEEETITIQPENIPLDIVFEDDSLIVVNKPSGMVVHPSKGHYSGTLVNALLYHSNSLSDSTSEEIYRPGLVHRIDKDTSGLLVIAKNNDVHQKLAEQIAENKMSREYIAIVDGHFAHETGVVDAPLSRHQTNRLKRVVEKGGKNAITHFEVLDSFSNYSLVSCRLETGRTHQIRAHMEFIKHPIVNDPLYHPKGKKATEFGQFLHARTLSFTHPLTGETLNFQVEPPKEFAEFIQLNKGHFED
ncbi:MULTISPECIES: RluA family pseudouridine synthase [unclassified Granulicatella]|uniref:RluA family pseudouridine synthase n=1 Tax=unclassified Granulicatella TaxID=2630493 RepID=UPI00066D3A46|nr:MULTISPECIES: RluA family pseudouridine synthase [unclassified Granulicatella]